MPYHIRVLAGAVDRGAGSHVYHQELVRRLAARGHRVSLVCFRSVPEVAGCAEVFEVPRRPAPPGPLLWRFAAVLDYLHCGRGLARLPLPEADVVIGGEHLFLRAHRRLFPRTPWLYLPHALVVDQEIRSYGLPGLMHWATTHLYVWLQQWALNHADRTLRFTETACAALRQRYGRSVQPRFAVNPMGVEVPEATPRAPIAGPVRLLWVGQLIARKRIDVALAALGRLQKHAWEFDVVGDGTSRPLLEAQARALGLAGRVRFHGFQQDPAAWYRAADLLLFPSWLENMPVTMLEAMSHGVPCLAMRGDGVRYHNANAEVVRHGVDGFLADSDEDFAGQLGRLLGRPDELRAAGAAARRTVLDRHTWDRHLARYEAIFEELLAGRPPRSVPVRSEEEVGV
jgi:glycosyltransferase involved in cell wall biosynthesis